MESKYVVKEVSQVMMLLSLRKPKSVEYKLLEIYLISLRLKGGKNLECKCILGHQVISHLISNKKKNVDQRIMLPKIVIYLNFQRRCPGELIVRNCY